MRADGPSLCANLTPNRSLLSLLNQVGRYQKVGKKVNGLIRASKCGTEGWEISNYWGPGWQERRNRERQLTIVPVGISGCPVGAPVKSPPLQGVRIDNMPPLLLFEESISSPGSLPAKVRSCRAPDYY
jgi:hypothetical protein